MSVVLFELSYTIVYFVHYQIGENCEAHNCDMIKRNESDVGDVVLEILAKKRVQIPLF